MTATRRNALRSTPLAQADVRDALEWSRDNFGRAAAFRYAALIRQALRDIAEAPHRIGSQQRLELPDGYRTYHLLWSRNNVLEDKVQRPRHFLLYRVNPKGIEILRVLHDSRDLSRHVPNTP